MPADVIVAGRQIDIIQPVAGDILAAGWRVVLSARADDDVRIAAGEVAINAPVTGDLTVAGGVIGIALAYLIAMAVGPLPLLGSLFEDDSGRGDIRLRIDFLTVAISTGVLLVTGVFSGLLPAMRAARLDPTEALRYE